MSDYPPDEAFASPEDRRWEKLRPAIDPLERCVSLLETMAKEQRRFAEEETNDGGSDGDAYEHAAGLLEKAITEIRSWQKT